MIQNKHKKIIYLLVISILLGFFPSLVKADSIEPYVDGYKDGTFKPNKKITREESSKMIYEINLQNNFKTKKVNNKKLNDISQSRWSYQAISDLTNLGVITGYKNGTFKPTAPITRAESLTMIIRLKYNQAPKNSSGFLDTKGHWAEEYIAYGEQLGIVTGYKNGTFKPNEPITRAEQIVMLNRLTNRNTHKFQNLKNPYKDINSKQWFYKDILKASMKYESERNILVKPLSKNNSNNNSNRNDRDNTGNSNSSNNSGNNNNNNNNSNNNNNNKEYGTIEVSYKDTENNQLLDTEKYKKEIKEKIVIKPRRIENYIPIEVKTSKAEKEQKESYLNKLKSFFISSINNVAYATTNEEFTITEEIKKGVKQITYVYKTIETSIEEEKNEDIDYIEGDITIRYLNNDKNKLKENKIIKGVKDQLVIIKPIKIKDYIPYKLEVFEEQKVINTIVNHQEFTINQKISNKDITVNYNYRLINSEKDKEIDKEIDYEKEKEHTITLNYKDTEDKTIKEETIKTGLISESYSIEPEVIEDYKLKKVVITNKDDSLTEITDESQFTISGTYKDKVKNITYVYEEKEHTITLNYKDTEDKTIKEETIKTGLISESYSIDPEVIEDYKLKKVVITNKDDSLTEITDESQFTISGTYKDKVKNITYVYEEEKTVDVKILYKEEDGYLIEEEIFKFYLDKENKIEPKVQRDLTPFKVEVIKNGEIKTVIENKLDDSKLVIEKNSSNLKDNELEIVFYYELDKFDYEKIDTNNYTITGWSRKYKQQLEFKEKRILDELPEVRNGKRVISIKDNAFNNQKIYKAFIPKHIKNIGTNSLSNNPLEFVFIDEEVNILNNTIDNDFYTLFTKGYPILNNKPIKLNTIVKHNNKWEFALISEETTNIKDKQNYINNQLIKVDNKDILGFVKEQTYIDTLNIPNIIYFNDSLKLVKGIKDNAFEDIQINNLNLTKIESLEIIGKSAFENSNISVLRFAPNSNIKRIEDKAFKTSTINSLNFKNISKLEHLGKEVFKNASLNTVDIQFTPNLKIIDDGAFYSSTISQLNLTNSSKLERIGNDSFYSANINDLNLKNTTNLKFISGFNNSPMKTFFKYDGGYDIDLLHPFLLTNVETIGDSAFEGMDMGHAQNPEIRFVENSKLKSIGNNAFKIPQAYTLLITNPASRDIKLGHSILGTSHNLMTVTIDSKTVRNSQFINTASYDLVGNKSNPDPFGNVYEQAQRQWTSSDNLVMKAPDKGVNKNWDYTSNRGRSMDIFNIPNINQDIPLEESNVEENKNMWEILFD